MLRVCVVLAGLLAGTVGAAAQTPAGLASDKALYERHRTEVARDWLKGEYQAVGIKIALCWKAFEDHKTIGRAKDCFLYHSAAAKMMSGIYARTPHKAFTQENVTEMTSLMLDILQIPKSQQPDILARWALATTSK